MNSNFVQIDIAEIHYEVFGHKRLELTIFNHIKLAVVSETAHQLVDCALIVSPVLFETLHLHLGFRQLFVELPQLFLLLALLFVCCLCEDFVLGELS